MTDADVQTPEEIAGKIGDDFALVKIKTITDLEKVIAAAITKERERVEDWKGKYEVASEHGKDADELNAKLIHNYNEMEAKLKEANERADALNQLYATAWSAQLRLKEECAHLEAKLKEAEEALRLSEMALNDWLHQYANEFCNKADVKDSWARIHAHGGTIAYIGEIVTAVKRAMDRKD